MGSLHSESVADTLKSCFPAENWDNYIENQEAVIDVKLNEIEKDVEEVIIDFLKGDDGGVLVLESIDYSQRDSWSKYILNNSVDYEIPQVEVWSHSSRICKNIFDRAKLETKSIYSVIYGGSTNIEKAIEDDLGDDKKEEVLLEVVPIKLNTFIDNKAIIIILEAHLISRSLNQSELVRFGSGRLLQDVFDFLGLDNNNKIVFIGDPYALTYGKIEDSSLDFETLNELYEGKICNFRQPISKEIEVGIFTLRKHLANCIDHKLFNNLDYVFDNSLIELAQNKVEEELKKWFVDKIQSEPNYCILFFSKIDALKSNLWIKNNVIMTGQEISQGDLLIVHNNVNLPDITGFNQPRKIVNGSFLLIKEVKDNKSFTIPIRQSPQPIILNFIKLEVTCLSINSKPEPDLWILENYFKSDDDLSKEEKIAFRIFINYRINEEKRNSPYIKSKEFVQLLENELFISLSKEEKDAIKILANNYNLPKEQKVKINTTQDARKLLSQSYQKYLKGIFFKIRETDFFVNAVFVKYGWSLTVHKALGSTYNEIVINGYQGENRGINNESYFRWLYSALTTAKNKVSIVNAQRINPLLHCEFVDNIEFFVSKKIMNKRFIVYNEIDIPKNLKDKFAGLNNSNVIGTIYNLSKLLEKISCILVSTKKFNDYLTKAIFSVQQSVSSSIIISFNNKGEKDNWAVSNISIEKVDKNIEQEIKSYIQILYSSQSRISINELNDFRKEIYLNWVQRLKKYGFIVNVVESHDNQDVLLIENSSESIKLRIWYGTSVIEKSNGFINKIHVIEKTGDSISNSVKNIILNE
jgi:hypothetical protein